MVVPWEKLLSHFNLGEIPVRCKGCGVVIRNGERYDCFSGVEVELISRSDRLYGLKLPNRAFFSSNLAKSIRVNGYTCTFWVHELVDFVD